MQIFSGAGTTALCSIAEKVGFWLNLGPAVRCFSANVFMEMGMRVCTGSMT